MPVAGTDGCSDSVALLKSSALAPDNSFLSPSVYTLQQTEAAPLVREGREPVAAAGGRVDWLTNPGHMRALGFAPSAPQVALYLHQGEANVTVLPDADMLAASAGGAEANSSVWLGCITAAGALMAGTVVDVIDGVEAADECCRLCREMDGECNAWNFCQQEGGCRCALGGRRLPLLRCRAAARGALLLFDASPSVPSPHRCCSFVQQNTNVSLEQFQCECLQEPW